MDHLFDFSITFRYFANYLNIATITSCQIVWYLTVQYCLCVNLFQYIWNLSKVLKRQLHLL